MSGLDLVRKETMDEIDTHDEVEGLRKLEAALFIAGRFLSVKELVALTDINPIMLRKLLEDLRDKYETGGLRIMQRDELWKMDVAPDHTGMVNRLATGSSEFSKAEQETLAIIAYKQPIKQSVLIKIRGNKGYEHVAKFATLGLVAKKKVGHTAVLSLTESFYDYFNIENEEGAHLQEHG